MSMLVILSSSGGGWMRLTYHSMTDISEKCPDESIQYSKIGVQTWCRPDNSRGCCVGITFLLDIHKCVSIKSIKI